MDVSFVIRQRLAELGLEQRDLAGAAQVTESYISQLLNRKKAPPAPDRTDIYEKIGKFLNLPNGHLTKLAEGQRLEELKRNLTHPPAPFFKEVRDLVIKKCRPEREKQVRVIFEKQAFGELERLVTQKLLDVTKKIAREELKKRAGCESCSAFLDPLIDSWDIDLKTFGMEVVLNQRLTSTQFMKFHKFAAGDCRL